MSKRPCNAACLKLCSPDGLDKIRLHESSGLSLHQIPRHRHQETLFSQVLEGEAMFQDVGSDQVLRAGPGDLVVLPAASVISGQLRGRRGWRMRTLWFKRLELAPVAERPVTILKAGQSSLIGQFATTFESLASSERPGDKERQLSKWLQGVVGHRLLEGRAPRAPLPLETSRLLEDVRQLIDSRIDGSPPLLEELGRQAGWHPHHLQRLFLQRFGVTPNQYHAHQRLEAALALLAQGVPAAVVSTRLGFSDQSHFIRSFRRHLGVTPGAVGGTPFRVAPKALLTAL